jgi:hypothetical protein
MAAGNNCSTTAPKQYFPFLVNKYALESTEIAIQSFFAHTNYLVNCKLTSEEKYISRENSISKNINFTCNSVQST